MTTLLIVGGALWVALRDLHRDAALGSLAELTVPYAAQARERFPLDVLRPRNPGERVRPEVLRRFRESQPGRREANAFRDFVERIQQEIDSAGISILLVQDGNTVVRDPQTGLIATLASQPAVEVPELRGVVTTGTTTIEGLGDVLYAATPVRNPRSDRSIPTLVLAREDDSARLATADLVRALAIAAFFLLIIGVPIAAGPEPFGDGPAASPGSGFGRGGPGRSPRAIAHQRAQ